MSSTLHMQHELVREVGKLHASVDKPEISFKGWRFQDAESESKLLGARALMLAGWVTARTSPSEVYMDLQDASLTGDDGFVLAEALQSIPRLTSIDVRGNPGLTEESVQALIQAMKDEKPGHPRSLCGVSPGNTRLDVPRKFAEGQEVDVQLIVAELESHVYAESVTAGMGGTVSGGVISLNRRGGGGAVEKGSWVPLIWAAKVNHLQVGAQLLKNGTPVDVQEAAGSHSQRFTALHTACYKGHADFVRMLLDAGADVNVHDVNGSPAKAQAEKKGHKDIVAMIEANKQKAKAAK